MGATSSLIHSAKPQIDGISDTVEIDPQYAQGLGFSQNDIVRPIRPYVWQWFEINSIFFKVEIGLLHDLPFAKCVTAEPLTSDDWEIIVSGLCRNNSPLCSNVRNTGNQCLAHRVDIAVASTRHKNRAGDRCMGSRQN